MHIEKGRISSGQLIFVIAAFMQGTVFITIYTFSNTPRDEFFISLISYAVFLPFALMYYKLSERFPNDTLLGIHEKVYGKTVGNIISLIYILLFIFLSTANYRFPSNFLTANFMIETPVLVFAFCLIVLSGFALKGGIEALGRLGLFVTLSVLLSLFIYFVFLINKMELTHFFPIMAVPPIKLLQNVNIIVTQYMGEIFIFTMMLPFVSKRKKLKKNYFLGTAIGVFTLLIIAILVTAVLGNYAAISTGPLVETTRMVEVANINARIEFIFMAFLTFTAFYKSCVFYYVSALSIAELFKLKSYTVLLIPVGLLIFSLVMPSAENGISMAAAGRNGWSFFSVIVLFIIPLITFLTALIRGLPKKQDSGAENQ